MPRHRAVLVLLVALAATGVARSAASETTRDPIAAEALFREGREQAKRGDFAAACPKFAESLRLDPTPGALFNLADCEERTGKLATAWLHYTQLSQQLPPGDDRLAVSREHMGALEPRLPRLTVSLAKDAPGSAVASRDGVSLGAGSLDSALPVDPGHHVVVASAPGFADRSFEIDMKEGETRTVVVTPGAPRVVRRAEASGTSGFGWVLTGVGIASIGVGAVTGVMVLGRKSTFEAHCVQKVCDAQGLDAASSGKTLSAVSTVTVVAGAALVGAGMYLVLTAREDGTTTSLAATPLVGGAATMLRGTF